MGIRTSNNDLPGINRNPFDKPNTVLVDKLIGSAYNVVRLVAENIEYIKHTSYYLEYVLKVEPYLKEISVLSENIDNFKTLFEQIEAINAIYTNLDKILSILKYIPELQKVSADINNIVKVANSIEGIDNISSKLDELLILSINLEELLKIKGYADQIALDKASVDTNTAYVKESREEIEKSRQEVSDNTAQVRIDADYVKANVATFALNIEFIKKSVEYTRIYAESAYFFAEDSRLYALQSKKYNDNLEKYKVYYYGALNTPPENAPIGSEYIDISKEPAVRMILTPQGWFPAHPSYRIEYTNNVWDGTNTWNNKTTFNSFAQFNNQAYFNNYAIFNNYTLFQKDIRVGKSLLYLNGDLEGIIWDGKLSEYINSYKLEVTQELAERDNNLLDHVASLGKLAYKDKIIPTDIGTEGTPSNLTFLRGDGQWVVITKESLSGGKDVLDNNNTWLGDQIFNGNISFKNNITVGNINLTTEGNIIGGIWGKDLKTYIDTEDTAINLRIDELDSNFSKNITDLTKTVTDNYNTLNTKIDNNYTSVNTKVDNNYKTIINAIYGQDTIPENPTSNKIVDNLLAADNTWTGTNTFNKKVTVSELYSLGEVSGFSDKRLKSNINLIPNALDKLSLINGYSYHRDDLNKDQTGVIAQEIEKILPNAVKRHENGYLMVDYNQIIPLLIESIKELSNKVEELSKGK